MSLDRDTQIRRYLAGRMEHDETGRFERSVLRDKIAQARMDQLRNQAQSLRELFTFGPWDLSRIAIGVRARNPHRAMGIPPAAALWLQVAGIVGVFLVLQAVGAYLPPPKVEIESAEGQIFLDARPLHTLERRGVAMNQEVRTTNGQVVLLVDDANRLHVAPYTRVRVRSPREGTRQLFELDNGEVRGRFNAENHGFALVLEEGEAEVSGVTADFHVAAGDRAAEFMPWDVSYEGPQPFAVVRVFRGSVTVATEARETSLRAGQWGILAKHRDFTTGEDDQENFRLLRFDAAGRFKDDLHWLATGTYPLRTENSVVALDRNLRELASRLHEWHSRHVVRKGRDEIQAFAAALREELSAAERRDLARSPEDVGEEAEADRRLIAARPVILELLDLWEERADYYSTIGRAAAALEATVKRMDDEAEYLLAQKDRASAYGKRLDQLALDTAALREEMEKLREHEAYDPDGTRRVEIDGRIEALGAAVKAGDEAVGKVELVRLKLNELDAKIDALAREHGPLAKAVKKAEGELETLADKLAKNAWTQQAEDTARESLTECDDALELLADEIEGLEGEVARAREALEPAETRVAEAKESLQKAEDVADAAGDALLNAVSERAAAEKTRDEKKKELQRLKEELDGLPEDSEEREVLQKRIDEAKEELDAAEGALAEAVKNADDARKDSDVAASARDGLSEKLAEAETALEKAEAAAASLQSDLDAKTAERDRWMEKREAADERIQALAQARSEREQILAEQETKTGELESAREKLAKNETAAADLEKQASPSREALRELLAKIEEGETARKEIKSLAALRDTSQAVDEDLERLQGRIGALEAERTEIEELPLVKNRERVLEDYAALSLRIEAYGAVRARALDEERAREQRRLDALERFDEESGKTADEAISMLEIFCPGYRGVSFSMDEGEGRNKRAEILALLWRLYFSTETTDEGQGRCYYDLARSGAPESAMRGLDDRWRAGLAKILPESEYRLATELTRERLSSSSAEPAHRK